MAGFALRQVGFCTPLIMGCLPLAASEREAASGIRAPGIVLPVSPRE